MNSLKSMKLIKRSRPVGAVGRALTEMMVGNLGRARRKEAPFPGLSEVGSYVSCYSFSIKVFSWFQLLGVHLQIRER